MSQPISPIGSVSLFFHLSIIFLGIFRPLVKPLFSKKYLKVKIFALLLLMISLIGTASILYINKSVETDNSKINLIASTTNTIVPDSQFSAWLPWWDENQVMQSLNNAKSMLHTISPVWYKLTREGHLKVINVKKKNDVISIASSSAIYVMPTVTNDDSGFNSVGVSTLLSDSNKQTMLIDELAEIALSNGYKGWDIDWEEIAASDKDKFSAFISDLGDKLHNNFLSLSVAVHAKEGNATDWTGTQGQDWEALVGSVDFLRIMAYDFHHEESSPGPVTPLDKLTSVLRYATKIIPKEKLVVGLPTYGYDWDNKKGTASTYSKSMKTIEKYNVVVSRDPKSEEMRGKYKVGNINHDLWFQDSQSVTAKVALARKYGVYKFIFWRLGDEDSSIWISSK